MRCEGSTESARKRSSLQRALPAGGVICELDSGSGTDSGRMLVVMEGILGNQ